SDVCSSDLGEHAAWIAILTGHVVDEEAPSRGGRSRGRQAGDESALAAARTAAGVERERGNLASRSFKVAPEVVGGPAGQGRGEGRFSGAPRHAGQVPDRTGARLAAVGGERGVKNKIEARLGARPIHLFPRQHREGERPREERLARQLQQRRALAIATVEQPRPSRRGSRLPEEPNAGAFEALETGAHHR